MAGSDHLSRRGFITWITAAVGSFITVVIGLPALDYLIAPALKSSTTDTWIPLGKLDSFEVGKPTLATFTRTIANGWEQTVNSYGVFVYRK